MTCAYHSMCIIKNLSSSCGSGEIDNISNRIIYRVIISCGCTVPRALIVLFYFNRARKLNIPNYSWSSAKRHYLTVNNFIFIVKFASHSSSFWIHALSCCTMRFNYKVWVLMNLPKWFCWTVINFVIIFMS